MKHRDDRYITRVDQSGRSSPMFWVRFTTGSNETLQHISQQSFYDHHYGGYYPALKAARKWRDEEQKRLGISDHHHRRKKYNKKARSTTGVTGVSHTDRWILKQRRPQHLRFYRVQWGQSMPDGTRRYPTKMFSYNGDVGSKEDAFKRAVAFRKKMERLHYDGCV